MQREANLLLNSGIKLLSAYDTNIHARGSHRQGFLSQWLKNGYQGVPLLGIGKSDEFYHLQLRLASF